MSLELQEAEREARVCERLPHYGHTHLHPQLDGWRATLCVSFRDVAGLDRSRGLGFKGCVVDLETLTTYEVWGADCGAAPCFCDLEAVLAADQGSPGASAQ